MAKQDVFNVNTLSQYCYRVRRTQEVNLIDFLNIFFRQGRVWSKIYIEGPVFFNMNRPRPANNVFFS